MLGLLSIGVGIGIFFAALEFSGLLSRESMKKIRLERSNQAKKVEVVEVGCATIADDFFPLILPYVSKGDRLEIIGSDLHYVVGKNGSALLEGLNNCIKKGVRIDYVAVSPDDKSNAIGLLKEIADKNDEVFNLYTLDSLDLEDGVQNLVKNYLTFHPTFLVRGDKIVVAWVEGYHAPGSVYAYGIKFFTSVGVLNAKILAQLEKYRQEICTIRLSCKKNDVSELEMGTAKETLAA